MMKAEVGGRDPRDRAYVEVDTALVPDDPDASINVARMASITGAEREAPTHASVRSPEAIASCAAEHIK